MRLLADAETASIPWRPWSFRALRAAHSHDDYRPGPVPVRLVDDFGERKTGLQWRYRVRSGRDRQLRYAFKYWKRYNPEFWNFNEVGGDCGNFVDRTLLARADRGRSRLRAGDVAFFDWEANGVPNHTMIVSDVRERAEGSTAVAFAGHNLDIRYRDLDDDVYREYPDAVVWCYAVRSSSTPS